MVYSTIDREPEYILCSPQELTHHQFLLLLEHFELHVNVSHESRNESRNENLPSTVWTQSIVSSSFIHALSEDLTAHFVLNS